MYASLWFVALEPGGEEFTWPDEWAASGGAEITDIRLPSKDTAWLQRDKALVGTWRAQVQTTLAYLGQPTDMDSCKAYRTDRFGRLDGDVLLLQLSAYAARNVGVNVPRYKYLEIRKRRIRELIERYKPRALVCLGRSRQRDFEEIIGGKFDNADCFALDQTLCLLRLHPAARHVRRSYWLDTGEFLRLVHSSSQNFLPLAVIDMIATITPKSPSRAH